MPNIASVLKSEITRLARKEMRGTTSALKRAASAHRSEIAALKRRVLELEQRLRRLSKDGRATREEAHDESQPRLRFSVRGLAAQRRRLGLSAQDVGLLIGTTGQAVYNWEAGKAKPRATHLVAIAALRKLGKRQAMAVLAERRGNGAQC